MKFLFVMDKLDGLNLDTDSTIEIIKGCSKKEIAIYYCEDSDLVFEGGKVYAYSAEILVEENNVVQNNKKKQFELDFFDLILMRKEPPYDLNYHYATMLLEKTSTPVVNHPKGLQNANEKLVVLNFPEIIPETLVTKELERILEFVDRHKKTVIKPIHLYGGKDVSIVAYDDADKEQKIKNIISNNENYAIIQEFMESVYDGDKRIFLLNGDALGAIVRKPKKGDFRANMAIGGIPLKSEISESDKIIIDRIKPYLVEHGLFLAGIDIIEDKLIEINVTCPTGLVPIKELNGKDITGAIVEFLVEEASKK